MEQNLNVTLVFDVFSSERWQIFFTVGDGDLFVLCILYWAVLSNGERVCLLKPRQLSLSVLMQYVVQ